MRLTFTLTTSSPATYVAIVKVLRDAERDGRVGREFSLKPDLESLPALADHACSLDREEEERS